MIYQNYTTFKATKDGAILTITFDYPPVNVQGIPMLDDLNRLAEILEGNCYSGDQIMSTEAQR